MYGNYKESKGYCFISPPKPGVVTCSTERRIVTRNDEPGRVDRRPGRVGDHARVVARVPRVYFRVAQNTGKVLKVSNNSPTMLGSPRLERPAILEPRDREGLVAALDAARDPRPLARGQLPERERRYRRRY